jgi:ubiquinone/menaquinone biosynthesis C-methylase UbiE
MPQMKNWCYNEFVHVGTDYESEEEVEKYDKRMSLFRNISGEVEEVVQSLDLKPDQVLLEYGCGTGEFSIEASRCCREVYAVDVSPVMLKYAEKKAGKRGRENIRFIESGFLNYRHSGDLPDAVVTQIALHHLPDFWKMIALKKIHENLKDGGSLYLRDVVFSMNLEKYEKTIDFTMNSVRAKAGDEMADSFERHIRQEYSTFDWIMEEMLYRAGFELLDADYREDFIAVYRCRKVSVKR